MPTPYGICIEPIRIQTDAAIFSSYGIFAGHFIAIYLIFCGCAATFSCNPQTSGYDLKLFIFKISNARFTIDLFWNFFVYLQTSKNRKLLNTSEFINNYLVIRSARFLPSCLLSQNTIYKRNSHLSIIISNLYLYFEYLFRFYFSLRQGF